MAALHGAAVWKAIDELLAGPGRVAIATAYLGRDGAALLAGLGRGDLVVVNAGDRALVNGATDPDALAALVGRGVTGRSHPDLHAKVYVAAARAIVGSANVSRTSRERWIEAATVSGAKADVAAMRAFVEGVATSTDAVTVDDAFLEYARKVYVPPRRSPGTTTARSSVRVWTHEYVAMPPAVRSTIRRQEKSWTAAGEDLASGLEHSWAAPGSWRRGDIWLAIEQEAGAGPDEGFTTLWRCKFAEPSKDPDLEVYWWELLSPSELRWGGVCRAVKADTGFQLEVGQTVRRPKVLASLAGIFDADLARET